VNPIDCGGKPSDRPVNSVMMVRESGRDRLKRCDEHYQKFITELWFSVRLAIEAGQFRGLKEAAMLEGCQREWMMVGQNKIEVEPKRIMKEKTGKSPDLFDAIAIGMEGARRLGFQILGFQHVEEEIKASPAWKRELAEKARNSWKEGSLNYTA